VVVQPDEDDPVWLASVAVLDEGGYEILRRDSSRNEREVSISSVVPRWVSPGGTHLLMSVGHQSMSTHWWSVGIRELQYSPARLLLRTVLDTVG